jgi:hypothetical protein
MPKPHPTLLRDLWEQFQRDNDNCSADTMLCRPSLRQAFLALHRSTFGPGEEEEILKNLLRVRKQKSGGLRKKGGDQ